MANPVYFIEQFVNQFLGQWHCGLAPTLSLHTKPNGTISISYNVDAPILPSWNFDHSTQRSGRRSRCRRRKKRSSQPSEDCHEENDDTTLKIQNEELGTDISTSLSSTTECIPEYDIAVPDPTAFDDTTLLVSTDFKSKFEALDLKLMDRIEKFEVDLRRLVTEVDSQVNQNQNSISTLSSDAIICDENIVNVARRITRVENYLRIPFIAD